MADVDTANNRVVTLSGFAPGYDLTTGDFMSFSYGSNPVRYAMHQFASDGVADSNGEIEIETNSFIRPGFALDTVVRLIKPFYKAVV
ncbi:hypothetical protein M3M33_13750, partial [Loigolactobacillus coryniformis]|uniref:hypothetical protein n=1 Tax=Loigolactobacillus coryniformis TaxID=1610 RepID=UPI00201B096F